VLKVRLLAGVLSALMALLGLVGSAVAAPEGTFAEFPVASEPVGIAPGPDGNLWFTEFKGNTIGRITPGGSVAEFPIPTPNSHSEWIAAGPDGNLWFTESRGDKIGRITPSGAITEFPLPAGEPQDIVLGPDGNLWFTELTGNAIGRIAPSGAITEFPIPNPESKPWGITAGPDGNLWFTEYKGDKIGRITTGGAITEFPIPTSASGPLGIAQGSDGNLYFTEFIANQIGRITTSGAIVEFPVPTASSFPGAIAPGPDGNMWFAEHGGDKIGRITPGGAITEFPIPVTNSMPEEISPGPDGNLWFTEGNANKIARIGTGAAEALASAPTVAGGGEAGKAQTCSTSWSTWISLQPSASLFGFDGYSWQLNGATVAAGQSYTPTVAEIGQQLACTETVTYPLLDVTASASSAPFAVQAPPLPTISALHQSASNWREGGALAQISSLHKQRRDGRRRGKHSAKKRQPPLGTTFTFALSEPASVSFSFTGHYSGRKVSHSCVAQTRKNAKHKSCERTLQVGALSFNGNSGANKVVFDGRIAPTQKLPPGRYALTITATNFAGGVSEPAVLRFTVVK
jgi:streptogramin lyase